MQSNIPILALALTLLSPALAAASTSCDCPIATGFIDKSITVEGYEFEYEIYVPRDYTPDKAWPVVAYLHGTGEAGSNALNVTTVGLADAIRYWPERVPALVVFPQLPPGLNWNQTGSQELVIDVLRKTFEEYSTDTDRVYLTGWSQGGEGSFRLAALYPEIFAAVVPLSGGFLTGVEDVAAKLVDVPIWTFHGDTDETVPVHYTKNLVELVRKAGGEKICFREIPGDKVLDLYEHEIRNGHSVWWSVYEQSQRTDCTIHDCTDFTCDVLDWMFSNSLGKGAPATN